MAIKHISVAATESGNGAENNPFGLYQAIGQNNGAIPPGDEGQIRGGTYNLDHSNDPDTFYAEVQGTSSSPILIRNYPGERARIDIDYQFWAYGNYVRYFGIEFFDSKTKKVYPSGWSSDRIANFNVFGDYTKITNCVIHDCELSSVFSDSVGGEYNGNLLYFMGMIAGNGPWGQAAYIQNESSVVKTVKDCTVGHGFRNGYQVYGSDSARVRGIDIIGNTLFEAGSLNLSNNGSRGVNCIVWVGEVPSENIKCNYNDFYHSVSTSGNVWLWGSGGNLNINLEVQHNFFIGGAPACDIEKWNPCVFKFNKIASDHSLIKAVIPSDRSGYDWNHNNYYYTGTADPFIVNGVGMSFDQWKTATGFDADSTFSTGSRIGMDIRVRPFDYFLGGAKITVWNWDDISSANVDLSTVGLTNGQPFVIKDAQNYYGDPVHTGTYNSSNPVVSIQLPGSSSAIAEVVGMNDPANAGKVRQPAHTSRKFNALILEPGTGGGSPSPSVSFLTPSNNAVISGTGNLTASVSPAGLILSHVRYFLDGVYLGQGSGTNHAYAWNTGSVSNGGHSLRTVATFSNNTTAQHTISVTVNNTSGNNPPTGSWVHPLQDDYIAGPTLLKINASDDQGVQSVQFHYRVNATGDYNNIGTLLTSAPWQTVWDTGGHAAYNNLELSALIKDVTNQPTRIAIGVKLVLPPDFAQVVNDTMTGSAGLLNSHTADSGHTWAGHGHEIYTGTLSLSGNGAVHAGNNTNRALSLSGYNPASNSNRLIATYETITQDGSLMGFVAQASATLDEMINFLYDGNNQRFEVRHRTGTDDTQLGVATGVIFSPGTHYVLADLYDGMISVFIMGVRRIGPIADPRANSPSRRIGIRAPGTPQTANTGHQISRFQVFSPPVILQSVGHSYSHLMIYKSQS